MSPNVNWSIELAFDMGTSAGSGRAVAALPVPHVIQAVAAAKTNDIAASIPSDAIGRRAAINLLVEFSDTG